MEKALRTKSSQSKPTAHAAGHHGKLTVCPNCETSLPHEENYCPNCGQQNHELKLPLSHLIYEVVESFTHFDDKLWLTLKAIFTRPGRITVDFLVGKRVRYVPPVRFYVFVSVIFFFLVGRFVEVRTERGMADEKKLPEAKAGTKYTDFANLMPNKDNLLRAKDLYLISRINVTVPTDSLAARRWVSQLRLLSNAQLDSLLIQEDEKWSKPTPQNRQKLREVIALLPDVPNIRSLRASLSLAGITLNFEDGAALKAYLQKMRGASDTSLDSLIRARGAKPNWVKRTLLRQASKFMYSEEDSTKAFMHVFVKDLSIVMFILMPFVAILLLFFYYRRGRYYYEHLIFSVHIHTVIFLFFSLALLGTYFAGEGVTNQVLGWTALVCWIYFLLSLKAVYQQSWIKTTVKFLLLSLSYTLFASLFLAGAVVWGFATF